jgi:aspartate/methionine/tyrosine aminotransferase
MIALANPNNPTGQVMSDASMKGLVEIAARHNIYVLSDEIYRGAEIDQPETPTFFGLYDRVVVTCSVSKSFANPGLRLGWIVGPQEMIPEVMRRQDYSSIGTGVLSQIIAERILASDKRDVVLARSRRILRENVEVLDKWIERSGGKFSCRRPQAGGVAFVRYELPLSSEDFSTLLRQEKSVFVVAGEWFGIDRHVRIGIGGERHHLEEALERISSFAEEQNSGRLSQSPMEATAV